MPNSICPRNSIFHRLFLNWGENIPRYFRSCSRVLKAIMLSYPMSVPFVVFCAWLFYHIQQLEPIFRLFHFQKLISPDKTRPLIVFRGQKLGIFQPFGGEPGPFPKPPSKQPIPLPRFLLLAVQSPTLRLPSRCNRPTALLQYFRNMLPTFDGCVLFPKDNRGPPTLGKLKDG